MRISVAIVSEKEGNKYFGALRGECADSKSLKFAVKFIQISNEPRSQ